MPSVTISARVASSGNDGHQQFDQRATGTIVTNAALPPPPLPHFAANIANAAWFIFTLTGISQGQQVNSAKLSFSSGNAWSLTGRTYIAVENNLDPLGTGAIISGTAGSAPYLRLTRGAAAVTRFGARCGPTHTGTLSSTGVPVRNLAALVYKAFGDNRGMPANTNNNLTDDFAGALQALVNDPGWNSTSQDVLVWMFPDEQSGTGNLGNLGGYTWSSGSGQTGNTSPTWGNGNGQLKTYDFSSVTAPQIIVDVEVTPIDGSSATDAGDLTLAPASVESGAFYPTTDISYTNGTALAAKDTTSSGLRTANYYAPVGTPPTGGWPVVLWIHGGFFTSGDKGTIPPGLIASAVSRGYAVVSADYRLVEIILSGFEYLANGNEASFPLNIHDIKVLINFLRLDQLGAKTYNVDVDNLILAGYSAGGSIAQFVAYSKGDTTTYEGLDSASWDLRPAPVGRVNNTANYYFDFNQNGMSGLDDFTVKGLFMFAGATSLQLGVDATATPNADARFAIGNGRRAYISRSVVGSGVTMDTFGEIDVDKYLSPASGTPVPSDPYLGRPQIVPDFPIGYVHGTGDVLVTKAAGYTPLESALITNGYVSGAPTLNVTSPDKLSYYEIPGLSHDDMQWHPLGIARFAEWLDATQVVTGPYFTYWDGVTEHEVTSAVYWNGSIEQEITAEV